jgi:DNA helicase II / ATP-dependent DNA helicase PcrA
MIYLKYWNSLCQTKPLIDEGEENGKVVISTVHSAKGLEWYAVFIPHAHESMLPSNKATNIEEMKEERRLFYLACSRAKEEL